MAVFREGRDFAVVLEQYSYGDGCMSMLGEGGAGIRQGDQLITTRGGLERWRVLGIERGVRSFSASLAPVVPLRLVPSEGDVAAAAADGKVVNLFGAR